MTRVLLLASALLGTMLVLVPGGEAPACAPAYARGARVDIAAESAIIVWDADNKTQHFIRRASFRTETPDFGFLVPTPTQPELAESKDAAFATLERATAPEVVTQTVRQTRGWGARSAVGAAALPQAADVTVLESKRVGGYDAVVLEAKDPEAMRKWLEKNGYEAREALTAWLEPYIKQGWKVTAFKIAKDARSDPGVATSAVRMSFKTDKPFFPYREPEDQHDQRPERFYGERLLRVYFIGQERVEGRLGEQAWPGKAVWAGQLKDEDRARLVEQLALPGKQAEKWVLTEMEDRSTPRPATADVFYVASSDQGDVRRPPIINTIYVEDEPPMMLSATLIVAVLATGVMLLGGVVIWLCVRSSARAA